MGPNTKANGKTTRDMVRGFFIIMLVVSNTKDNGKMTRDMGME
jgi:hypothetical protein